LQQIFDLVLCLWATSELGAISWGLWSTNNSTPGVVKNITELKNETSKKQTELIRILMRTMLFSTKVSINLQDPLSPFDDGLLSRFKEDFQKRLERN
jgi:hypothetical protein